MKIQVAIKSFKTVNEVDDYWTVEDYTKLLSEFNFEAESTDINELKELLYMGITDVEPHEAAEICLSYKLGEILTEGQIQNIALEMLKDRVAEEYRDTSLHYDLFNINQLLYKAYNGKFPNTEATIIEFSLSSSEGNFLDPEFDIKEILIKSIKGGLKESSLVKRLYHRQLDAEVEFTDLKNIIWRFKKNSDKDFEILTSRYLMEKNDFEFSEFESEIQFYKE